MVSGAADVTAAHRKGTATFMGVEFFVAPGALVPRSETELLGRTALDVIKAVNSASPRVIDVCCGVGNLACVIGLNVAGARLWAADLTDGCVALSQRNVERCALQEQVIVRQGDLFGALEGLGLEGTIDVVVCNPPYIPDRRLETDRAQLLELEPREAFAAGPYGFGVHLRVVQAALEFLRPGGALLLEVGLGQAPQVKKLLERRGYVEVSAVCNDAGEERVVLGKRSIPDALEHR